VSSLTVDGRDHNLTERPSLAHGVFDDYGMSGNTHSVAIFGTSASWRTGAGVACYAGVIGGATGDEVAGGVAIEHDNTDMLYDMTGIGALVANLHLQARLDCRSRRTAQAI
tara:strand:- start:4591 stop:4923 length:333 start_codon:yes stop_codon:yes gene_type:complete